MNVREGERWLAELRARFVAIARRRVPPEAVEDVVQDTLRIVIEKGWNGPGAADLDGRPALAWCMQALRNVIGNHYQRTRVRAARAADPARLERVADGRREPLEALAGRDAERIVRAALADLSRGDAPCGRWLWALAEDRTPGELAREAGIEEGAFYRRLWRCREKLRAALADRGWTA